MSEISELLNELTKKPEYNSKKGEIISVDLDNFTCVVKPHDGEANYLGVKLSAHPTASNVLIPTVGSIVIISFLDKDNAFLAMSSANDKTIVRNIDEEGDIQASLLPTVQDFVAEMKDGLGELKAALNTMTLLTSAGPTTAPPINSAAFTSAFNTLDGGLDDYLDNMEKLFGE